MAAIYASGIVDRVRSLCVSTPFFLAEAESWQTFELQPSQNDSGVFRIPPPSSQGFEGGFSFREARTDILQIWIARKIENQNDGPVRQRLLDDANSLTSAVVRDAHVTSGDYLVLDEGRGVAVLVDPGKEYASLRLSLPVNYEVQL
jgi:hypothetical protein